ncbi:MAG: Mut7-C RNAse domain-containing protein [Deltaproteobacteria bacterium]
MRFILTRELGRLVRWLRILGYDTVYFNRDNTSALIIQALRDNRVILTRNHRAAASARAKTVLLQSENIKNQLLEILKELKPGINSDMMFTRCIICNAELIGIDKDKVRERVPEYVFNTQESFLTCPLCRRIYWQGTHWGNVRAVLKEIGVS